jgi:high-affinity Fe2+/Pb2+ permease
MDNSSLNTGLLVVIIVTLVAGGMWYFSSQRAEEEQRSGIEITLPSDTNNENNR